MNDKAPDHGKGPGRVTVAREAAVATVLLDRQGALNAMTAAMYEALAYACRSFAEMEGLRAVVFRGAGGRAFSAGSDIAMMQAFDGASDGLAYEERMDHYLDLVAGIAVPTVAVVEGLAVGGGLNIATACDIRIATTDSRFGVPVARTLGGCLSMRNMGALVDAFGVGRVKRMMMMSELIDADEARACGFLARVVERERLEDELTKLLQILVANAPITQRVSKAEIARLRARSLPDGDDLIATCYGSQDFAEGVDAFLDKRKPVWRGQ